MGQLTRYYAIAEVSSDYAVAYDQMCAVTAALKPLGSEVFGYEASLLLGEEDFRQQGIDKEPYLAHSGGKFPIVFIAATYIPGEFDVGKLAPIEREHDLVLLRESP